MKQFLRMWYPFMLPKLNEKRFCSINKTLFKKY
jgi:hypothetical protein